MKPLFLVGCPRSGTTLLQQILDRHPAVRVIPETAYFSTLVGLGKSGLRRHWARMVEDLGVTVPPPAGRLGWDARTARTYLDLAALVAGDDAAGLAWFGDKTPDHLRVAIRIAGLLPEARFLALTRDGRDVAASLAAVPWAPPHPGAGFAMWLDSRRHHRRLLAAHPERTCELRFEDLVNRPATEIERVLAFLGLPPGAEPLLRTDGAARGIPARELPWKGRATGPPQPDRAGAWRRSLEPALAAALSDWGRRELTEAGYEIPADSSGGRRARAAATLHRWVWRLRRAPAILRDRWL